MKFIDTHAHLYLSAFENDLSEVIEKAHKNNIDKILLPNIDINSIPLMNNIVSQYHNICFPMIGLHPTSVKNDFVNQLNTIESELASNKKKYIAIGEIGIDLYWDKKYINQQIIAFKKQLQLANKYNLPVSIHTRSSFKETINVLNEMHELNIKGVFHCFSGSIENAIEIINKGFLLGIGGVVTFKNSDLPDVIRNIDIKHIVLETDAPFLAPTPYRGKRNESLYINNIADKLSEIYMLSTEKIAEITTQNADKLFKLIND